MKYTLPTILLATLPLCAVEEQPPAPCPPAQRVHAFRPPSREQVAMRMMVRQLLLDRYDSNQDAELDADERRRLMEDAQAARKQQALAFVRRFDADGDGKLTPEESETMQQAMEERRHAQAEGEEPAQPQPRAGKRGQHHSQPRGHRPPHPRMGKESRVVAFMVQQLTMDAYDADKNGHLDREESDRLREDGARLYQAREAELLSRYDADKDGALTKDELRAALDELLPRRPEPAPRAKGSPPPPRHHGRGHGRNPINRLLDTHFDVDILLNLAHPQAAANAPAPCSPSTPSAN